MTCRRCRQAEEPRWMRDEVCWGCLVFIAGMRARRIPVRVANDYVGDLYIPRER